MKNEQKSIQITNVCSFKYKNGNNCKRKPIICIGNKNSNQVEVLNLKKCPSKNTVKLCHIHLAFLLRSSKRKLFSILKKSGITTKTLIAMKKVPRELFVPDKYKLSSYLNQPLNIGQNQTISQPYIVARMIDLLKIKSSSSKILEIGTGSGYNLAVLSKFVSKPGYIVSIERIKSLSQNAKKSLKLAKIERVKLIMGDGSLGCKKYSPYDRIIVTAGATNLIPEPLMLQLKINGILVIPSGGVLKRITRVSRDEFTTEYFDSVRFVPLIGKYGIK